MNLGDVPTWVAAIGTVGALIAALIQINTERKRRRVTEADDRFERRLAQARLVSAFLGSEEIRGRPTPPSAERPDGGQVTRGTPIYVVNGSEEPVYEPVVGLVAIQGAAPHTLEQWLETRRQNAGLQEYRPVPIMTVSILPPGKSVVWIEGTGWSQHLSGRSAAEIAFTDRAGIHWIRRASGQLVELPEGPLQYFGRYGLMSPYEFQTPEPLS